MNTKRKPQKSNDPAIKQLQALEAKMAAWMESKGEALTDDELRELCSLRSRVLKVSK